MKRDTKKLFRCILIEIPSSKSIKRIISYQKEGKTPNTILVIMSSIIPTNFAIKLGADMISKVIQANQL